jgi:hypothetical protein
LLKVNASYKCREKEIYAIEEQMYLKEIKAEMTVKQNAISKVVCSKCKRSNKKGLK